MHPHPVPSLATGDTPQTPQPRPAGSEGSCGEGDRVRAVDDIGAPCTSRLGTILRVTAASSYGGVLLDVDMFVLVEWDDGDIEVLPVDRIVGCEPAEPDPSLPEAPQPAETAASTGQ